MKLYSFHKFPFKITDNIPFVTNPAGGEIIATTFRRTQLPNGGFTISRAPLDSGEKVTSLDRFGLNHRFCWPLLEKILGWAIFLSTIVIFSVVYFKKFGLVIFLEVGTSHYVVKVFAFILAQWYCILKICSFVKFVKLLSNLAI